MQSVRPDAPWCPSNIEFIRRINGLDIDRRRAAHRLRRRATWCSAWATSTSARRSRRRSIRATGWSRPSTTRRAPGRRRTRSASAAPTCASTAWRARAATSSSAAPARCGTASTRPREFPHGKPWLLRFFDQIRFYPVSERRAARVPRRVPARAASALKIEETTFRFADYRAFLRRERARRSRRSGRASRRRSTRSASAGPRCRRRPRSRRRPAPRPRTALPAGRDRRPRRRHGQRLADLRSRPATRVAAGDRLVVLETMKMETPVLAPAAGRRRRGVLRARRAGARGPDADGSARSTRSAARRAFVTSCESPAFALPRGGLRCVQHPRIQVGCGRGRGSRVFVDPQRPARAPPADTRHPGARRGRGRRDIRGRRGVLPPRKMRPRAPRIDARGGAEVLPEVEQHVDHARPHLSRRRQRSGVVPIADDLPLAAEGAVDGERQSNREPVHATAGTARLIPLDDEVPVVLLDREVDHPEAIDRRPRDGASERSEHARRAKRRQPGRCSDGDLHRDSAGRPWVG